MDDEYFKNCQVIFSINTLMSHVENNFINDNFYKKIIKNNLLRQHQVYIDGKQVNMFYYVGMPSASSFLIEGMIASAWSILLC